MTDHAPLLMTGVGRTFVDGRTDRHVLVDISLRVERGEMVALMGPSGSGKSTILSLGAGLDTPTVGQVQINGVRLAGLNAAGLAELRRTHVGYIEQQLNLLAALTAAENVALPLELGGTSARAAKQQALDALDSVGLVDLADEPADRLSGGEQQRVAIARSLVGERRLVLADEPTGALDSLTGESVMRLLRARCDDGASVLLATHDPGHAAWADRVVFLRDGYLIDESRPALDELHVDVAVHVDPSGSDDDALSEGRS